MTMVRRVFFNKDMLAARSHAHWLISKQAWNGNKTIGVFSSHACPGGSATLWHTLKYTLWHTPMGDMARAEANQWGAVTWDCRSIPEHIWIRHRTRLQGASSGLGKFARWQVQFSPKNFLLYPFLWNKVCFGPFPSPTDHHFKQSLDPIIYQSIKLCQLPQNVMSVLRFFTIPGNVWLTVLWLSKSRTTCPLQPSSPPPWNWKIWDLFLTLDLDVMHSLHTHPTSQALPSWPGKP